MLLPNFFVQALILTLEEPTSNGVQEGFTSNGVEEGPALSGVEG